MTTCVCPHCKTELPEDQARERRYHCPDCGQFMIARSTPRPPISAVRPAPRSAPPPKPAPKPAPVPPRPGVPQTLDELHAQFRSLLAAQHQAAATEPSAAPAPDPVAPEPLPVPAAPASLAAAGAVPSGPSACLVLPPPENERDAATMEQLLSTLGDLPSPVAFEIAADDRERKLMVRAEPATLRRVRSAIHGGYDRAEMEDLKPADDPARPAPEETPWRGLRLKPALAEFLPLKIWREFKEQEPLGQLLAGFDGLQPGETALSQMIVHNPAPKGWANGHLRQLAALERRGYGAEMPAPARNFAAIIGVILCIIFGVVAVVWAFGSYWPRVLIAGPICFGLAFVGVSLWRVARSEWVQSLDEDAAQKLHDSALLVEVRLFARAATPARALEILSQMSGAYGLFNTNSGNRFETTPLKEGAGPADFLAPPEKREPPPAILSVKEAAGLWHLPVLTAVQLVKHQAYERKLPRPDDVCDPAGAPIGVSIKGERSIPVRLGRAALDANIFLVGMTQMGKSNLMGQIARHLAQDPGRSLIVVDPHGDLVRRLVGLMPRERLADVIYLDFTDEARSAGLNLLDVSDGTDPHTVAENFVDVGRALWADYWGPRMVVPMENALRALAFANRQRPADRQFTILALSTLLTCDPEVRQTFLDREVPDAVAPTVQRYFRGEFNDSSNSFREQVLSPVLSKANAFERSPIILRLIGQPRSTVHLFEAIQGRKIILVNIASGTIGHDLAGFLGSLFVNMMRRVIARQQSLSPEQRVRVSLVADEFQTLKGVNWGPLLGELQKFGGSFVLGTQGLGNLLEDQVGKAAVENIFSGVRTTIALGTNGADAYYLTKHQLGAEQIRPGSLMDLPRGVAYVKTLDPQGRPIPAYSVALDPLPAPDPEIERSALARRDAYTVPAAEADRLYRLSLSMFDEYAVPGPTTADVYRALQSLEAGPAPTARTDVDQREDASVVQPQPLRGVPLPPDRTGRETAYALAPTAPQGPESAAGMCDPHPVARPEPAADSEPDADPAPEPLAEDEPPAAPATESEAAAPPAGTAPSSGPAPAGIFRGTMAQPDTTPACSGPVIRPQRRAAGAPGGQPPAFVQPPLMAASAEAEPATPAIPESALAASSEPPASAPAAAWPTSVSGAIKRGVVMGNSNLIRQPRK